MAPDGNINLFEEFTTPSKKDWIKTALNDLKEKDFSRLIWYTEEGINMDPFYAKEDLDPLFTDIVASQFSSIAPWKYYEIINSADPETGNRLALDALNNGADGITFHLNENNKKELDLLLKGILPEHCHISFIINGLNIVTIKELFKPSFAPSLFPNFTNGSLFYDPIASWTLDGKDYSPQLAILKDLFTISEDFPNYKLLTINSEIFKNSGTTIIQELAMVISLMISYANELKKQGIRLESFFSKIQFNIPIGSNFFFEIAKLRALRILATRVAEAYGTATQEGFPSIHAEPAYWTKTLLDPSVNILRNTTEAMAGILGGCTSLSILPHDFLHKHPDQFAQRISRNISNILKEESYFDKVNNPVSGSYYVEALTQKLIIKAWELVQKIETQGGFIAAFEKGFLVAMVQEEYNKKLASVTNQDKKVIGSNYSVNKEITPAIIHNSRLEKTKRGWFEYDRLTEVLEKSL